MEEALLALSILGFIVVAFIWVVMSEIKYNSTTLIQFRHRPNWARHPIKT